MEKLLIIGIDTLAGSNLALSLANRCEIAGISLCENFAFDGCRVLPIRAAETDKVCSAIAAESPTWIVHCGPTSRSSWDFEEFDAAQTVALVAATAATAKSCGTRFTLVSTDAIFQGPKLFHREISEVGEGPRSIAAARVEKALAGVDALTIRTHLFGWSPAGDSSVEQIWEAIADDRTVPACGNRYASPILAIDFAELLWLANRKRLTGTFHLAGAERISKWQFAMLMVLASGASPNDFRRGLGVANGTIEFSSNDEETSLDSRQVQRLIETPLSMLRDAIARFVEQATNGHRDRLQAGWTSETAAAA